MKKLRILFVLLLTLLSLSSCNLATMLNEKFGLKSPVDKNMVTFYADQGSDDFFILDLGDSFNWTSEVSLNTLLGYEDFAEWYENLENENWEAVGLYMPGTNKGLLTGSFYLEKGQAVCVGWNSPFEKIRIYANNFTDEYFDYYFPNGGYAYDEIVDINFARISRDAEVNQWINNLSHYFDPRNGYWGYYYPEGFTDVKYDQNYFYPYEYSNYRTVSLSKWNAFTRIGWTDIQTFSDFVVSSENNDGSENLFIFEFDASYSSLEVSWSLFERNEAFMEWYNSLERPGYAKKGIIFNGWYMGPESSDYNYMYYYNRNVEVRWVPLVSSVTIYANNDTDDYYVFDLGAEFEETYISWEILATDNNYIAWYESIKKEGYLPLGLIRNDYYYTDYVNVTPESPGRGEYISGYEHELRVVWVESFNTIEIYPNNGSSKDPFVLDLGKDYASFELSYELLYENQDFIAWYDSLVYSGHLPVGINTAKYTEDYYSSLTIRKETSTLYVIWWESFDTITVYPNNGSKAEPFVLKLENEVASCYFEWSDFYSYEGFEQWYNSLEKDGYEKIWFSTSETESWGSTYFQIRKETSTIYVCWAKLFDTVKIYANNGTNDYFVYSLPSEKTYEYVYWSQLESTPGFIEWYNSLEKEGYVKAGISTYIYSSSGDCSPVNNGSFYVSDQSNAYVCWTEGFDYIRIFANNTSEDYFDYKLNETVGEIGISWNDLINNGDFARWYNSLSYGTFGKSGLARWRGDSYPEISFTNNNKIRIDYNNRYLYVIWRDTVSSVVIKANNGTGDEFIFNLDSEYVEKYITWNELERNDGFMNWYKGLANGNLYTCGIGYDEISWAMRQYYSSDAFRISPDSFEFYVMWTDYKDVWEGNVYYSLGETRLGMETGETRQIGYHIYSGYEFAGASVKELSFSSNNPFVVSVDSHGLMEARSEGSADITIKVTGYRGEDYSLTQNIAVFDNPEFKFYSYLPMPYENVVLSDDGKTMAAAWDSSIYISRDYGKTWTEKRLPSGRHNISRSGASIVRGYEDGIFVSKDYGETFTLLRNDIREIAYLSVSDDGNTVACGFVTEDAENPFRNEITHDGGLTWKEFLPGQRVDEVKLSGSGDFLVCKTSSGYFWSLDGGESFTSYVEAYRYGSYQSYLSTDGTKLLYMQLVLETDGISFKIYKAEEGGNPVEINFPEEPYAGNFWASPSGNVIMYNGRSGYDYISIDGGLYWEKIKTDLYSEDKVFITNEGKIFLFDSSTGYKLYCYEN